MGRDLRGLVKSFCVFPSTQKHNKIEKKDVKDKDIRCWEP